MIIIAPCLFHVKERCKEKSFKQVNTIVLMLNFQLLYCHLKMKILDVCLLISFVIQFIQLDELAFSKHITAMLPMHPI